MTIAFATSAVAGAPSFMSYGKITSGYHFVDQRFVVSDRCSAQGGTTATWKDGWYLDLWGSENCGMKSLTKDKSSEFDFTGGWAGTCWLDLTCHVQVAHYVEPTLGSFRYDIDRARFELKDTFALLGGTFEWYVGNDYFSFQHAPDTDVVRGGVSAHWQVSDHWTVGVRLGVAHDIHPDNTTGSYELEASYDFGNGFSAGPYVEGFQALNHTSKVYVAAHPGTPADNVVAGIQFAKSW